MAQENNIAQQLNDLLVTRDFHPDMRDAQGKVCDSSDAKVFTFDYVSGAGKDYGTMVIILDSGNDLKAMFGNNLGRGMEDADKDEWYEFQQQLSQFANSHRWTYTGDDISKLKYTMQGLAAIKEGLFEGYYGTRRISYAGEPTQARLMIRHNRNLGENDARFRYVESIFVETADGERHRLPFTNLAGGRAMLEHVRQGGKPYDVRGNHICEMITELKVLARFNRASQGRVVEGVKQSVVQGAQTYYKSLRENIKRLSSPRGYTAYFESWHPASITEQDQLVEDIKTLFVEQTIDDRIEQALPLLAKIQQGREMKEAEIFENWVNNVTEGTWSLPETPEQMTKLKELMSGELIVGPDGTNATEQLYDLIGDDVLFDRIGELAAQDPRANVWDDTDIQARMQELGIQMPDRSAADMDAQPQQGVAEDQLDEIGDTPAGQAALQKYQDKAHNQVAAHWQQVQNKSYLPTDPKMAKRNAGTVAAGNRIHGFGIAKNQQDKVTGRFDYRDAVGKTHVYQKNDPLEQGVAEAINETEYPGQLDTSKLILKSIRHTGGDSHPGSPGYFSGPVYDNSGQYIGNLGFFPGGKLSSSNYSWSSKAVLSVKNPRDPHLQDYWEKMGKDKIGYGNFPLDYKITDLNDPLMKQAISQVEKLKQGVAEADNIAAFESLQRMRHLSGMKLEEARIEESSEYTYEKIGQTLAQQQPHLDVNSDQFRHAVYNEMIDMGMTPKSANYTLNYDEDFLSDVANSFHHYVRHQPDGQTVGQVMSQVGTRGLSGRPAPLTECNSTMEGHFCPVHGLSECWSQGMYEDILSTGIQLAEDDDTKARAKAAFDDLDKPDTELKTSSDDALRTRAAAQKGTKIKDMNALDSESWKKEVDQFQKQKQNQQTNEATPDTPMTPMTPATVGGRPTRPVAPVRPVAPEAPSMMNPQIPGDFGSNDHLQRLMKLAGAYKAGDPSALKKSNDAMLARMTGQDKSSAADVAPSFKTLGAAHAGQGGSDYQDEEPKGQAHSGQGGSNYYNYDDADQSSAETARLGKLRNPNVDPALAHMLINPNNPDAFAMQRPEEPNDRKMNDANYINSLNPDGVEKPPIDLGLPPGQLDKNSWDDMMKTVPGQDNDAWADLMKQIGTKQTDVSEADAPANMQYRAKGFTELPMQSLHGGYKNNGSYPPATPPAKTPSADVTKDPLFRAAMNRIDADNKAKGQMGSTAPEVPPSDLQKAPPLSSNKVTTVDTTGTFESREGDALLARIKSLALIR